MKNVHKDIVISVYSMVNLLHIWRSHQEIINKRRQRYWKETKSKSFWKIKAPDKKYLQVKVENTRWQYFNLYIQVFIFNFWQVAMIMEVARACQWNNSTFLCQPCIKQRQLLTNSAYENKYFKKFQDLEGSFFSPCCRRENFYAISIWLENVLFVHSTQHVDTNTITKTFSKVASFLEHPD